MKDLKSNLEDLEEVFNRDWSTATIELKVEVIKVLQQIYPVLGKIGMKGWATRISHMWHIPLTRVWKLLEGKNVELALLEPLLIGKRASKDIYPKEGFISDYLTYTLNSEAPKSFHFWVAISVLGAVFGRNVSFPRGHSQVFPNHFIVIVAPSGRCKKTSAGDIGIDLLWELEGLNVIAEKVTPEALVDSMKSSGGGESKECRGFIYAPELPVFLGKQQYNEGMIDLITRLADNPRKWDYRTRTKSIVKLTNVNAAMLGCVTPDGLTSAIPATAFGGGFMSRFLFVMEKQTSRELALPPQRNDLQREQLLQTLKKFQKQKRQFSMSAESEKWYINWYHQLRIDSDKVDDPRMCGYYARKQDHLLRLTMVITLAEDLEPVFTVEKFEEALRIFDTLEIPMPDAFVNPNAPALGKNNQRVLDQLIAAGSEGIQHSKLLKKNYRQMDKNGLAKCIETLISANLIDAAQTAGKVFYYVKRGG